MLRIESDKAPKRGFLSLFRKVKHNCVWTPWVADNCKGMTRRSCTECQIVESKKYNAFHNWSKWTAPVSYAYTSTKQQRVCLDCHYVETHIFEPNYHE